MKGNLKIAQAFEDGIGRLWDGVDLQEDEGMEVYSCSCVYDLYAKYFIDCVEPGLRGEYKAFGSSSYSEKMWYYSFSEMENKSSVPLKKRMHIQMMRALWLTLLAEVAERGEEFPNEVVDWKYRNC